MSAVSAGLLVYRRTERGPEFLLGHPGGPFWKDKDDAAWSIPKGLVEGDESPRDAAHREFAEEIGQSIDADAAGIALAPCRASGKTIQAWLVEGDLDVSMVTSNTFTMEWPPRSGKQAVFPEVDRAAWFDAATARMRIHKGQRPILEEAIARLAND